jgi:H+-transporting ATPase
VSLSDFLTLFSARTHSEFFWARKPSPVLLGAASLALTISTVLASVWPDGKTDGIEVKGLCLGGATRDKLWPLWVWIYCIFWWFVQDAVKVATYWVMVKYDVFQIRTAGLVNLRDASRFNDPAHPLARESVGVVEAKNLDNKVNNAISHVTELARTSGGNAGLARVSQKLALARTSGAGKGKANIEGGVQDGNEVINEIEEAVEGTSDPAQRAALQKPLKEVQDATAKLAESKSAMK